MQILKATDPLPERPAIILITGEAGVGKTTLANTSNNPLLMDFDRGTSRALFRKDTFVVSKWEDVLEGEQDQTYKKYNTIIIDTPKGALDDFLMSYVQRMDVRNQRNKLAAYGAIGSDFSLFVANRRTEDADIILNCHEKIVEDGDFKRREPDVTGQSLGLLMRIADQVGYMSIKNKKRVITWEPSEITRGKNVAGFPDMIVPDKSDPALSHFMADIISEVRKAICRKSNDQLKAEEDMRLWHEAVSGESDPENLTRMVKEANELTPKGFQTAVKRMIADRAKELTLQWNKDENYFELAKEVTI